MSKGDLVRFHHMLDAALEIFQFTRDRTRDDLEYDRKLVLALVKDIEIIGEAAARMTDATQEKYRQIPWASIVAMRNRLIHAYYDIDLDRVWDTVVEDIPPLASELQKIIEEIEK